jgi:predicted membrane-bound spermidine synthase
MQTSGDVRPWKKYVGLALAAVAGAAVMVVELGVARVLTPVFGGSIAVWAIVIATTMLALAAGYAVGGYLADRFGGIRVAPLEPLVRPTAEYLRHQARDYLPVNVLYY